MPAERVVVLGTEEIPGVTEPTPLHQQGFVFVPITGPLRRQFGTDIVLAEVFVEEHRLRSEPLGLYDPNLREQVIVEDSRGLRSHYSLRQPPVDFKWEIKDQVDHFLERTHPGDIRRLYRWVADPDS